MHAVRRRPRHFQYYLDTLAERVAHCRNGSATGDHYEAHVEGKSGTGVTTLTFQHFCLLGEDILAPMKIKSAFPPPRPKKKTKIPPPFERGILRAWGFPAERTHFWRVPIKLAQPFPAPELRAKNFTCPRIFLIFSGNAEGSRNPWVMKCHRRLGCWFISL